MIRTGYSFGSAIGHVADVVARLKEIGWKRAPIADRASTFGYVNWAKACEKDGLVPAFGVEIGVAPAANAKKPTLDYWTFIATKSLRPLHDLIYAATSALGEPHLTYEQAAGLGKGLVAITGERCLLDRVDLEEIFVGLSPATPIGLYREAKKRGAAFVLTPRNVYPRVGDLELYRVMVGKKAGTQTYSQHVASDDEMREEMWYVDPKDVDAAIWTRNDALSECLSKLPRAQLLSPEVPMNLRGMCEGGADHLGVDLSDGSPYRARLEHELTMIAEKKFEDYFYIIAELVDWAKKRMVVGPARGSSCGSLVCYLTGITAIDPLRHDLIFERFIDITRADLPDIDLDFSEAHRDEVFDHARELYGDRVARLGSVNMFAPRSALATVGAALKIPSELVDAVAETVIKRMTGDNRKSSTIEDTLAETDAGRRMVSLYPESAIVSRMEGHPHNATRHAAGLVATACPVLDYVAVDARNGTTMCNKYDAETLNLLKIDVLGLTQLTIFERAMDLIGVEAISGWHEKIPLDDPEAFDVLNRQKFCGVFQFEGAAMRNLAREIEFTHIDDIVAATALVRPGPMGSGGTDSWVARKSGREKVEVAHPLIEPFVAETFGVVAYQEQILRIGREVGGLSWADVTALRKAMSKSLGREYFDQFGDRWKAEAIRKGMPTDVAEKFWNDMCQFGMWAFNKAHSVSYAYVSYWCCWWKAHYPVEYAAACLDMQGDVVKQLEMLKELRSEGVDYIPVDVENSTDRWTPIEYGDGRKVLLGPLSNVRGVGPAKMREIMSRRKNGEALPAGLAKMMANPRTPIDSLYPIRDRVAEMYPNGLKERNITTTPTPVGEVMEHRDEDVVIVATPSRLLPKDENNPAKLAKRGYPVDQLGRRVNGVDPDKIKPSKSLVMFLRDDTSEVLAKVSPRDFDEVGLGVIERGRTNKAIYAFKGRVDRRFNMLWVDMVRYLGDME